MRKSKFLLSFGINRDLWRTDEAAEWRKISAEQAEGRDMFRGAVIELDRLKSHAHIIKAAGRLQRCRELNGKSCLQGAPAFPQSPPTVNGGETLPC